MKLLILIAVAFISLHASALAAGDGWTSDFSAAKKLAADVGKDLIIDFTGSDWCGACIILKGEVLGREAFKNGVKNNFVLVEIDLPHNESKLPEETRKQNEELKKQYAINQYPTLLLCDAKGRPYYAAELQRAGPAEYAALFQEWRGIKTTRDQLFAAASMLDGTAKTAVLAAGLEKMNLNESLITAFYGDLVDQIKTADPTDTIGFVKKPVGDSRAKLQKPTAGGVKEGASKPADATGESLDELITRAQFYAMDGEYKSALNTLNEANLLFPGNPKIEKERKGLESSAKIYSLLGDVNIFFMRENWTDALKATDELRAIFLKREKKKE